MHKHSSALITQHHTALDHLHALRLEQLAPKAWVILCIKAQRARIIPAAHHQAQSQRAVKAQHVVLDRHDKDHTSVRLGAFRRDRLAASWIRWQQVRNMPWKVCA